MASEKFIQFQMRRPNGSTLGEHTIVDFKNFFRDMCVQYFIQNPIKIGGPGRTVQIDEAFVTKRFVKFYQIHYNITTRKYNRGRLVNEAVMIFGGIEEEGGECFIWSVERRDASTLLTLIECYILPGTTIVSDCWRAYRRIEQLPEGYRHLTVNHSVNFVDPDTGARTNSIEQLWQKFKKRHKNEFGTARTVFEGYVSDFCWRRRFKGPDTFFHFWSQVASYYDIQ